MQTERTDETAVALALHSGFLMQGQGRGAAQSGAFPLSCKKEEQGGELNDAITLTASVQMWSVSHLHFLLIKGRNVVKPQINEGRVQYTTFLSQE